MKRTLSLVGFIISTAMLAIDAILELIGIALIFELLSAVGAGSFLFGVIALITIALVVVALVFNAMSIATWNKSPENYKKGFVIATVVINFVLVLIMLIGAILGTAGVMGILVMISLVAANVLAIIDLVKENKTPVAQPEAQVEEQPEVQE